MSTSNKFDIPNNVTFENFSTFFGSYITWKQSLSSSVKKVIFDFTDSKLLNPVVIAFLASEEDHFKYQGIEILVSFKPESRVEKFLSAFGYTNTKTIDEYTRNMHNNAVPITKIKTVQESLEVTNKILPKLLKRVKCSDDLIATLNWSIGELIDNAGNHGYKSYDYDEYQGIVYVCCFSYMSKVQIVVLDRGQGIISSLKTKYSGFKDKELLQKSTERGVTGHPIASPGFGLYGTSKLAKKGAGLLYVISEGYGLRINEKKAFTFNIPSYVGTLVSIDINAGSSIALSEVLGEHKGNPEDYFDLHNIEFIDE